jgi:hypothetical protein
MIDAVHMQHAEPPVIVQEVKRRKRRSSRSQYERRRGTGRGTLARTAGFVTLGTILLLDDSGEECRVYQLNRDGTVWCEILR